MSNRMKAEAMQYKHGHPACSGQRIIWVQRLVVNRELKQAVSHFVSVKSSLVHDLANKEKAIAVAHQEKKHKIRWFPRERNAN